MNISTENKAFPFTYDGWDESGGDYGDVQFYKVKFVDDFGPVKKGDKFDCVFVMYKEAKISCVINGPQNAEGFAPATEVHNISFKVVPA